VGRGAAPRFEPEAHPQVEDERFWQPRSRPGKRSDRIGRPEAAAAVGPDERQADSQGGEEEGPKWRQNLERGGIPSGHLRARRALPNQLIAVFLFTRYLPAYNIFRREDRLGC